MSHGLPVPRPAEAYCWATIFAARWHISRRTSHTATTCAPANGKSDFILLVPRPPVPIIPSATRSEGGVLPSRPKTVEGTMQGVIMAAAAAANCRRVIRPAMLAAIGLEGRVGCPDSVI
jgi:hypothetical protein